MKMHWCTGKINLAGQSYTFVKIEATRPASWPELQVLQALHGDENVIDIKPCRISDTSVRAEKNRLLGKYGAVVEKIFPGHTPRIEMLMPGETEDQPRVDDEGEALHTNGTPGPGPDDDDDDGTETKPAEPPTGQAVFKPSRTAPPPRN
jgi:hypothetical protein